MTITEGFLFFKDWESSMRGLTKKDFFALFWAMYDYQMYGKAFPEFSGKAQIIASFIEPQLKRRISNSLSGTKGAERKREIAETSAACGNGETTLEAPPSEKLDPSLEGSLAANSEEKENRKNKDNDFAIEERENVTVPRPRAESGGDIFLKKEAAGDGDFQSREDGNVKQLYGRRRNVILTPNERGLIRATIPDSDDYIDMFSEKLYSKGYSYSDHCEAILRWWEKDKKSVFEHGCGAFAADDGECIDPNARYRDMDAAFERACSVSGVKIEED